MFLKGDHILDENWQPLLRNHFRSLCPKIQEIFLLQGIFEAIWFILPKGRNKASRTPKKGLLILLASCRVDQKPDGWLGTMCFLHSTKLPCSLNSKCRDVTPRLEEGPRHCRQHWTVNSAGDGQCPLLSEPSFPYFPLCLSNRTDRRHKTYINISCFQCVTEQRGPSDIWKFCDPDQQDGLRQDFLFIQHISSIIQL